MANTLLVVVVLALLSACTTPSQVILPSGETGYKLYCVGGNQCLEKADKICPSGFVVVSSDIRRHAEPGIGGIPVWSYDKRMLIQCEEQSGPTGEAI